MTHKVLIADDEPNIVISLEYLMKREGYEVQHRARRPGGAGRDPPRAPALVLLDVMMPRKSGFEVCQELRADEHAQGHAGADAHRQGPRHRRRQGPGRGRRRLHDQALLHQGAGGQGAPRCWARRLEAHRHATGSRRCWRRACCWRCLRWAAARPSGPRWTSRSARCWARRCNHSGMVLMLVGLGLWALGAWGAQRGCTSATWPRAGAAAGTGAGAGRRRAAASRSRRPAARRCKAWRRASTSWCASARSLRERHGAEGGRGQPAHRPGAQPPGGADVRADAKRGGVQPGRPHPALQPARAGAVPRTVVGARAGRRRRADRPGPLDLRACSSASWWRMRWRRSTARLQRGAAQPTAQFVTTTPAGQLLRVQMTPVRGTRAGRSAPCTASC